ncbi:FHA domain-containing protein [bacterium]|nr:FHA domain-containing protein [bacterium]
MADKHHCSFVSRLQWRRPGASLHPSVHVVSLHQNCTSAASNRTFGWLVGTNGAHRGEDFRLTEGDIVLGSGWDADIVLTSPEVSRTHAKFTSTSHVCMVEDLGSGSGVFVNSERCEDPRPLKHGDVVKVGMGEFIYFELDPAGEIANLNTSIAAGSADGGAGNVADEKPATLGWLICETGELQGLDFRLMPGVNRVGSLSGLEVTIPDANLNSIHFSIESSRERMYLRQMSANVQLLRARLLIEPGTLKDSDVLQVGALRLRLRCFT